MSSVRLTSNTLNATPNPGEIEYNGQFFATDSASSRAQMQRLFLSTTQTASGTSVDFTSIPSWVKRITVMFSGISLSGNAAPLIQLGTSGGIQASGYLGAGADGPTLGAASYTTGFGLRYASATAVIHGSVQICLMTPATNTWVASGTTARSDGAAVGWTAGTVSLTGTLDRVRITSTGTDTFDAGSINILYEG